MRHSYISEMLMSFENKQYEEVWVGSGIFYFGIHEKLCFFETVDNPSYSLAILQLSFSYPLAIHSYPEYENNKIPDTFHFYKYKET